MHPPLSFDQAPPISAPYRFFVTAPWFAAAAGLLLLIEGSALLTSRWVPATLAATHLIVLGFMLQAMCGALLQFIPVAIGGNVWQPLRLATFSHSALVVGTLLLAGGLYGQQGGLLLAAALCLGAGLGVYLIVIGLALWRTPATSDTVVALRLGHLALVVTLLTGLTMAVGLATHQPWPLPALSNVHAGWGLFGWSLMLLAGVSYFVVPMFQLTPAYPHWLRRALAPVLLLLLLGWAMLFPDFVSPWREVLLVAGFAVVVTYATVTLRLQQRRRRKVKDSTFLLFRVAMGSWLAAAMATLGLVATPDHLDHDRGVVSIALLVLLGGFGSVINGMLYKIMPFINWLHLQQRYSACGKLPPTMDKMLPEQHMRQQFRVHVVALLVLLVAVWLPPLARPAGLLLLLDAGWLGLNLAAIVRAYRRYQHALDDSVLPLNVC